MQDPRVRTRVISDGQLAEQLATGKAPPSVKSSQKKRTEKGGLLGKLGMRSVESTGMPDAYIKASELAPAATASRHISLCLSHTRHTLFLSLPPSPFFEPEVFRGTAHAEKVWRRHSGCHAGCPDHAAGRNDSLRHRLQAGERL